MTLRKFALAFACLAASDQTDKGGCELSKGHGEICKGAAERLHQLIHYRHTDSPI
jgi:hypothetical protein